MYITMHVLLHLCEGILFIGLMKVQGSERAGTKPETPEFNTSILFSSEQSEKDAKKSIYLTRM